jgi:hypothetical protein
VGSDNSDLDPAKGPRSRPTDSNRRTFIARLVGGIAIAVPAFRVLTRSEPAQAETMSARPQVGPDSCSGSCDPCENVYVVYNGHKCQPYGIVTCNSKYGGGTCIGYYTTYSVDTGQECSTFIDNEGPCSG